MEVLYVHDRAGQRPRDPGNPLDLGDDKLAEIIDVVRLGPDDHVVGTGDVVRLGYAPDLPDVHGDVGGLTNLCLNEDISLNHAVLPGAKCGGHATLGTRWLACWLCPARAVCHPRTEQASCRRQARGLAGGARRPTVRA